MNLLSLMAAPASDGSSAGSMSVTLITFVLIILIFYFLIIRPQKKKDKEAKAMLDALKKGDKVVTIGGIHGTVVAVKDNTVVLKVDDSARIEFSKNAISTVTTRDGAKVNPSKKDSKEVKKEEIKEEKKAEKEEAKLEKDEEKAVSEEIKEIEKEEKDN